MNTPITKIYAIITLFLFLLSCSREKPPVPAPEYIFDNSHLKVISSIINKKKGTIAVIYGNSLAFNAAFNARGEHVNGEKFKMVTWKLKPMPNWYGTDMNGKIIAIETVDISKRASGEMVFEYLCKPAIENKQTAIDSQKRAAFIVGLPAAVFP